MCKLEILIAAAALLVSASQTSAQDLGAGAPAGSRPMTRSGFPGMIWYFDGRDDTRDFPTNGFFPGDFAANPAAVAIGAAGIFGYAPSSACNGHAPQTIVGSAHGRISRSGRYRSDNRISGTSFGSAVRAGC
jgi:hypothetical protein